MPRSPSRRRHISLVAAWGAGDAPQTIDCVRFRPTRLFYPAVSIRNPGETAYRKYPSRRQNPSAIRLDDRMIGAGARSSFFELGQKHEPESVSSTDNPRVQNVIPISTTTEGADHVNTSSWLAEKWRWQVTSVL